MEVESGIVKEVVPTVEGWTRITLTLLDSPRWDETSVNYHTTLSETERRYLAGRNIDIITRDSDLRNGGITEEITCAGGSYHKVNLSPEQVKRILNSNP
ncbi:MAG: hypothetical protein KKE05_03355 [Nanoarchaeota archaeon]|nr:hypothetical protein [Nanoarchaeota archaeon]